MRLSDMQAEHLEEARNLVQGYMHDLVPKVQHIEDAEERAEALKELEQREIDRQLKRLWEVEYDRTNRQWEQEQERQAAVRARQTVNDLVENGSLPNDPQIKQEYERRQAENDLDQLLSNRLSQFCLSDQPLSLETLEDAFPKMRKADILRRLEKKDMHFLALRRGIGLHYPELPKAMRQAVERLFREGKLAVVISTDTLALGISMPCRSVVFLGDNPALDSLNYHQMSGRAGRRGHDIRGHVIQCVERVAHRDINERWRGGFRLTPAECQHQSAHGRRTRQADSQLCNRRVICRRTHPYAAIETSCGWTEQECL